MVSRIPDDREGTCYLCGGRSAHVHHIFGGSSRNASDRHRLVLHLCPDCHNMVHSKDGKDVRLYLHQLGQKVYEREIGTREQFREEFIRSYL